MALRNEIFEGLAAAQATKRLLYDPREWYAEELYKAARRKNKQDEEREAERRKIQAAGPPTPLGTGAAPTSSAGTTTALANPAPPQGGAVAVATEGSPFRYDSAGMPTPAVDPFSNSILNRGTYRRGGKVQHFEDGGMSMPNDPEMSYDPNNPTRRFRRLGQTPPPVDPDKIIGEMTERALGGPPVGTDPETGMFADEVSRGAPLSKPPVAVDTRSWGERHSQGGADPTTGKPFGGAKYGGAKYGGGTYGSGKFGKSRPITDEETRETEERTAAESGPLAGDRGGGSGMRGPDRDMPRPIIPKGSKADRYLTTARQGLSLVNPFAGPPISGKEIAEIIRPPPDALDQYQRHQDRIRTQNDLPGMLATPEEEEQKLRERSTKLKELDAKDKALETKGRPSEELEQRPTYATQPAVVPTLSDVIEQGGVPQQYGPHRPPDQPKPTTNGPAVPSKSTPGGSPGATTTPPPGANGANRPTNVTKPAANGANVPAPANGANVPMAPGPGGRQVPRGSLEDQSRITAYNPQSDAADPNNKKYVDFDGRDIRQVIGGAMEYGQANGPPSVLGEGASSRQGLHSYIAAHNPQARFSPGEALLAGMVSDYRLLLAQGRMEEANRMAYGLIQAATIEAASFGKEAMAMMKQGNYQTAAQQFIRGVNYFPDGMTHKLGPDGQTVTTTNNKGEVTARTTISPEMLLQAVAGLADGSMFWKSLQGAAALTQRPDRNASKRKLDEELRREQIVGARLRNDLLRNPRARGGRQPAVLSDTARNIYGRTGNAPKEESHSNGNGDQYVAPDTSHVDIEVPTIPDDDDNR